MDCLLASVGILSSPAGRVLLVVHLVISVFAIGAAGHHWRLLLKRDVPAAQLRRYARWMAIAYTLAFLAGMLIYPSYNVLIRKPPLGMLEASAPWAVGLFEINEHLASIALAMLPWLAFSAHRYEQLGRVERVSYIAGTWVFTLFVCYAFIAGALVTMVRSF